MVPDPDERPPGDGGEEGAAKRPILPDDHWSRARAERNADTIDYLREKSRAPGVAEGGSHRNSYCLQCGGVIPLEYDSREPADEDAKVVCPHCGAVQESRVRAMFNWVELDQVPSGDLAALLPWILGIGVVLAAALLYAFYG